MTIPAAAKPTPLSAHNADVPFVDPQTGLLTTAAMLFLDRLRLRNLAGNRILPCSAAGTNIITLTPNDASPLLEGYRDYEIFAFVAANTSTGSVTATVVPATGTLSTLKVYKSDGATQAGSGDIVQNSLYLLIYADHLDSSAGGFVRK